MSAPGAGGPTHGVTIEAAVTADAELVAAVQRLVPQVSSSAAQPTAYEVERIVESPATTLFIARDAESQIVGSLTLAVFRTPTGVRAWIEDVVVDASARGSGIGSALVEAAVASARRDEARTVDLTSRSDRTEANRLYQRLGFERRETNVYRRTLEPREARSAGA
jgi:ribosomal protein S18 acetylase RimI-like enzyme